MSENKKDRSEDFFEGLLNTGDLIDILRDMLYFMNVIRLHIPDKHVRSRTLRQMSRNSSALMDIIYTQIYNIHEVRDLELEDEDLDNELES